MGDAQLREAATELPERWWFAPHANDAEAKRFQRPESKKDMQARCPCLPRPAAPHPEEYPRAVTGRNLINRHASPQLVF